MFEKVRTTQFGAPDLCTYVDGGSVMALQARVLGVRSSLAARRCAPARRRCVARAAQKAVGGAGNRDPALSIEVDNGGAATKMCGPLSQPSSCSVVLMFCSSPARSVVRATNKVGVLHALTTTFKARQRARV